MYRREIPRDLFNEAKLLKSLGQLALLLHDGVDIRWLLRFEHEDPEQGFLIEQDRDSGDIYCNNLILYLDCKRVWIYSGLNNRAVYSLLFDASENCPGGAVLTEDGKLHPDFVTWLDNV